MFYQKKKKKQLLRFIDDVLEINYQSCCILSGPPCIVLIGKAQASFKSITLKRAIKYKQNSEHYFDENRIKNNN